MTRVLLCDPVPVRRAFVRDVLEQEPAIVVVGEFAGVDTVDLPATGETPDVVIVAVDGTRITHAAAVSRLRRILNGGQVLALCDCDHRRVGPGRVTLLPRHTAPDDLRREVLAAAPPRPGRVVVARDDRESIMIGDDIPS